MAEYEAHQILEIKCPSPRCPLPHRVVRDEVRNGKQRYECQGCGNHFFDSGQALHKQYRADQIGAAVDKYMSGMSYGEVAQHMEDFRDVPRPSKASVHAWVKAYSKLANQFMAGAVGFDGTEETATGQRIRAHVGPDWVADELVIHVGGRKVWLWNVMDRDTRYILTALVRVNRSTDDAYLVMELARANADREPETVTTDQLGSYTDAIAASFPKAQHIQSEGIYEEVNNNLSERLQKTIRSRIKTMDGMETQRTAQDYLDGWVLDYNFFKDHRAHKGATPAEMAGVAELVPWRDWGDITKLGGEVCEARVKEHRMVSKPGGPKPKPVFSTKQKMVEDAVATYREANIVKAGYANRRRRAVPVAPFPKKRKPAVSRGRGKKGMKV